MANEDNSSKEIQQKKEKMDEMIQKAQRLKEFATPAPAPVPQSKNNDEETMKELMPLLKDILEDGAMSLVLEEITMGGGTLVAMLKMVKLYPKLKKALELISKMNGGYGKVGKELKKKAEQLFESGLGKAKGGFESVGKGVNKVKDFSKEQAGPIGLISLFTGLIGLIYAVMGKVHLADEDIKKISDKVHADFLFWDSIGKKPETSKPSTKTLQDKQKCECGKDSSKIDEQDAKLDAILKAVHMGKGEDGKYHLQNQETDEVKKLSKEDKEAFNEKNGVLTVATAIEFFEKADRRANMKQAALLGELSKLQRGGAISEEWTKKLIDTLDDSDDFETLFQQFFYRELDLVFEPLLP